MSIKIYIPDDLITCVNYGGPQGNKNRAARFTCVFADENDTVWHESTGWLWNEEKGLSQPQHRGRFYRYPAYVHEAIEARCRELGAIKRVLAAGSNSAD